MGAVLPKSAPVPFSSFWLLPNCPHFNRHFRGMPPTLDPVLSPPRPRARSAGIIWDLPCGAAFFPDFTFCAPPERHLWSSPCPCSLQGGLDQVGESADLGQQEQDVFTPQSCNGTPEDPELKCRSEGRASSTSCCGLHCIPPKRCVQTPTPRTCEYDLTYYSGYKVYADVIKVNREHSALAWALTPATDVLRKRAKFGHTGRGSCEGGDGRWTEKATS